MARLFSHCDLCQAGKAGLTGQLERGPTLLQSNQLTFTFCVDFLCFAKFSILTLINILHSNI